MKPLIITAGDEKFKDIIGLSTEMMDKLGYRYLVYDLGGLGMGRSWQGTVRKVLKDPKFAWDELLPSGARNLQAPSPYKPILIKEAMETNEWEWMMWLDGDAAIVQNIDEVFEEQYDVGVTIRDQSKPKPEQINAGVIFFRNTPATHRFVDTWIANHKKQPDLCDQTMLNKWFKDRNIKLGREDRRTTKIIDNTTVKFWPMCVYNFTVGNPSRFRIAEKRNSKIYHNKASYYPQNLALRDLFVKTLREKYGT
jgi:hypothetical protein